jgi:hypothetical protein
VSPALQEKQNPRKKTPFDEKAVMREADHDAAAAVVLLQREGGRGGRSAAARKGGGGGESH